MREPTGCANAEVQRKVANPRFFSLGAHEESRAGQPKRLKVFIDDFELTALSLGGTVGLPSPPPVTGSIDVVAPSDPSDPVYLRITQRLSLKLIVRRIVRLSDVALIQAPVGTFATTSGAKRQKQSTSIMNTEPRR